VENHLISVGRNILANYASQIYATVIGIVMVPLYIRYLGTEAYGLVGFFSMSQALFQMLDMGLTPTMARETARFNGGAIDALSLRRLLRALEGVFFGVAILGSAALMASADIISSSWLKAQQLPLEEVRNAIMLMAMIIALRWVSGLYRGAVTGFEYMVWLSGCNIAVATARFVLVIPFLAYVGATPTHFFGFQLAVAATETILLVSMTYRLLPPIETGKSVRWSWAPIRNVLKFSLSIAFTGSTWILVTHVDKLVLSKLLVLEEYAYFTLAVVLANGVVFISAPITSALLPRLNKLASRKDDEEFYRLYRQGTQSVAIVAIPAAAVLAAFAEEVLWIWTGNAHIARSAAPILTLYSLGTGLLSVASFPAHLQVAKGDLRLHVIGAALFVSILTPMLILASTRYGAIGAGYSWLCMNLLYFLFWIPKVHRRFKSNLHTEWLKDDIAGILFCSVVSTTSARYFVSWSDDRAFASLQLVAISAVILLIGAIGSSFLREKVASALRYKLRTAGKEI